MVGILRFDQLNYVLNKSKNVLTIFKELFL